MAEQRAKILHLSTVHDANDVRILRRECASLAAAGFDVVLMAVADRAETVGGVRIEPLRRYRSRLVRLVWGQLVALAKALQLAPKVVHFHDPELIPAALVLSATGRKVIYDVHENVREGLWSKPWIPMKRLLLPIFFRLENLALQRFAVVFAEESYPKHYPELGTRFTTVLNFPDSAMLMPFETVERSSELNLFYIGSVTRARGALVMLRALEILGNQGHRVRFECVGRVGDDLTSDPVFNELTRRLADKVTFHGRLDVLSGYELSRNCSIGLCVLQPDKNYVESYPTKLFEYMAIGLPFITSNFPLYVGLAEETGAGVAIDPTDPRLLAATILRLAQDPEERLRMAKAGVTASRGKFNWRSQRSNLMALYSELFTVSQMPS